MESIFNEGKDKCKSMLEEGCKYVLVYASRHNEATAIFHENIQVVTGFHNGYFDVMFDNEVGRYKHVVPIDSFGKILS